jgi:hypothetical protein
MLNDTIAGAVKWYWQGEKTITYPAKAGSDTTLRLMFFAGK